MRGNERIGAALTLLLCFCGVACSSISDSSRSISRSISSPSESSSENEEDSMYKSKIRDYSYGYAKAGGDPQAFARGIGALAQRRGIHDWEKDETTCRAIGEGFRDAGAGQSASANALNPVVPAKSNCGVWIRTGYHDRK
jgi:hypothetical protein